MSRLLSGVVGAILIVVLAFVLNPSPEQHRARIKTAISERSLVARTLGVGALTALVSSYTSLGIAS